jgi:hypothetical protein
VSTTSNGHPCRQPRVEALAGDLAPVDADVLVAGDLPGPGHRVGDAGGDEDEVPVVLWPGAGPLVGDYHGREV